MVSDIEGRSSLLYAHFHQNLCESTKFSIKSGGSSPGASPMYYIGRINKPCFSLRESARDLESIFSLIFL